MGIILCVIWAHFVADFVCQTSWMALNKSKQALPLLVHVSVYSALLIPFGLKYAAMNGAAHLATDFVTSRITSRLWAAQNFRWFFLIIGLDQAIHMTCLIVTLNYR